MFPEYLRIFPSAVLHAGNRSSCIHLYKPGACWEQVVVHSPVQTRADFEKHSPSTVVVFCSQDAGCVCVCVCVCVCMCVCMGAGESSAKDDPLSLVAQCQSVYQPVLRTLFCMSCMCTCFRPTCIVFCFVLLVVYVCV